MANYWDKFQEVKPENGKKNYWDKFEEVKSNSNDSIFSDKDKAGLDAALTKYMENPPSFTSKVLEGVSAVGKAVDSYTGAPVRKAIGSLQNDGSVVDAVKSGASQFGKDPSTAPTSETIRKDSGLDLGDNKIIDKDGYLAKAMQLQPSTMIASEILKRVSPNQLAEIGIDIGADITNIIPVVAALKKGASLFKLTEPLAKKAAVSLPENALSEASRVIKEPVKVSPAPSNIIPEVKPKQPAEVAVKLPVQGSPDERGLIRQFLNPKQAPDYAETVKTAQKYGINPEDLSSAIEFGKDSSISHWERSLAEGVGGARLREKHSQGYEKISDAFKRNQEKIAGIADEIGDENAGNVIKKSMSDHQENLFKENDITYKSVENYAKGIFLDRDAKAELLKKLRPMLSYAKKAEKTNLSNELTAKARAVTQMADAIMRESTTYKKTNELRELVGEMAFNKKEAFGYVSPDKKMMQDAYHAVSDALIKTVDRHINPDFAKELRANNEKFTNFFNDRDKIKAAMSDDLSSERLFKSILVNGDIQKINILKKRMAPEDFNKLKAAFLDNIIKKDPDGIISFNQAYSALKSKRNQASAIFNPEELQSLNDIIGIGKNYGQSVLSSSGTGGSLGHAIEGMTNPVSGAAKLANTLGVDYVKKNMIKSMKTSARVKGENLWAEKGLEKFKFNDREMSLIEGNEKIKKLLIQASDLKEGSPQLKKIEQKIRSNF